MKAIRLLAALITFTTTATAQDYKLGSVTREELEEKAHPTDASAPAAVLFSRCTNSMLYTESSGFQLVTEVDMKIKIYKKEGYEYANKTVSYYNSETDKETVSVTKALTYNLVNGKIEKTKLKSEGEFTETLNKNWRAKKIMMPDVKEGSVVEYRYTITSPFLSVMPDWMFQQEIPVNTSKLITRIPEYYVFKPSFRGYYMPQISKTGATKSIYSTTKERSGTYVTQTKFSTDKLDYQEESIEYTLNNLPALKDESFVSNIDTYAAGIEHEISIIRYPNQPIKSFSSSWEDVAKTIYKNDDFGAELNKSGYYEDAVKPIIAAAKTPQEKIAALFVFVKGHMNWNENYGYSCRDGVRKAFKDKTGNVAEINLMLTSMLRSAGLDANPVLISTRSQKVPLFPSHSAFNYVVCGVKVGESVVLLDATSKNSMPNVLPTRALNWVGRMIKENGTVQEINLVPASLSRENITVMAKVESNGKCSGRTRYQYTDQNALRFRENVVGTSTESYLERLEKRYNGLEVAGYKTQDEKDLTKPVMEEYEFSNGSGVEIIGDKLYISPMLYFTQSQNPFKLDKRDYPIDFIYPQQEKYMVSIALPEGYVIESIPQSAAVNMEENIGSFRYSMQPQGKGVQVMMSMDINYPVIPATYYETLKSFFQKMIEKQSEKIVLKKA